MGEEAFILIPDNGTYSVKFQATGNGSFDFKIRKFEDDAISQEILYKDIPLTNSTKAETQFDTSSGQSPIVHLDSDGNGTIDQEIDPFVAPTSTPAPTPTSTPTPTPTPIPTPTSVVIVKSSGKEIGNENIIALNQTVGVAGATDINTDIIKNSERQKQDLLAMLVLSMAIIPQILSQVTLLSSSKKFW